MNTQYLNADYLNNDNGAIFDDQRVYRYLLWRRWNAKLPKLMVIGLNPSAADEKKDDTTIGKLRAGAIRLGFGELLMCNLFAYRATSPSVMKTHSNPIGELTDEILLGCKSVATTVMACWGDDGSLLDRDSKVIILLKDLECYDRNKSGQLRHPRTPGRVTSLVPFCRNGERLPFKS
jgi:hypothetical protein